MNLPALRVLRQSYPKAWIALLLDKRVAGLFRGHPDLDELIAVDADELKRSGRKRRQLVGDIRKARFDLGIVSNPLKFFHWMLFSCGIPLRAGWRRKWPIFLNRTLPDTKNKKVRHEIDSNLDLVGLVAKERWDGRILMAEDKRAKEVIAALTKPLNPALPIVAVHPGSSNPRKLWPSERFVELCRRLEASKACQLVLVGGDEERGASKAIAAQLTGSFMDLTGRLTLHPRCGMLSRRVALSSFRGLCGQLP
jgi:ADP-heptose:LPS heptosyltransferase